VVITLTGLPPHISQTDELYPAILGSYPVRRYVWEQEYNADSYLQVLNTYSGHIALNPSVRTRLFEGIRALIDTRFGGRIRKGYLSLLYVAQKRNP